MDDLKNLKPGMLTYDLAGMPAFDTTKVYLINPSIDHPIVPGQPVPMSNVIELHNVKVTPSVFIEPEMVAPKVEVPKEPFSIRRGLRECSLKRSGCQGS